MRSSSTSNCVPPLSSRARPTAITASRTAASSSSSTHARLLQSLHAASDPQSGAQALAELLSGPLPSPRTRRAFWRPARRSAATARHPTTSRQSCRLPARQPAQQPPTARRNAYLLAYWLSRPRVLRQGRMARRKELGQGLAAAATRNASNSPAAAATTWRCLARCLAGANLSRQRLGSQRPQRADLQWRWRRTHQLPGVAGWPPASSPTRGSRAPASIDADARRRPAWCDAPRGGSQLDRNAKLTGMTSVGRRRFLTAPTCAPRGWRSVAVSRELAGALLEGATAPGAEHPDLPLPPARSEALLQSLFALRSHSDSRSQRRLVARRPPPALRRRSTARCACGMPRAGQEIRALAGHPRFGDGASPSSPDGRRLLSGGDDVMNAAPCGTPSRGRSSAPSPGIRAG
jgi:hypothetical protein